MTTSRSRKRKPTLERTEPIRSWSRLAAPPTTTGAASHTASAAPGRSARAAKKKGADSRAADNKEATAAPKEAASDPISRAVELGYKVVEDYVGRGVEAARARGAEAGASAVAADMQKLTERMFQYASDFAGVWLEMMQRMTAENVAMRAAATPVPPAGPGRSTPAADADGRPDLATEARQAAGAAPALSFDVESARRVEINLDLRSPETIAGELDVQPLRAAEDESRRLTGVRLERATGDLRFTVRLRVPPDQPAGSYCGIVIDRDSNLPRGTLSVRVAGDRS